MSKTKTVHHPHLPGVSYEVAEGSAADWKAAGWRYTEPTHKAVSEAPAHVEDAPVSE